MIGEQNGVSQRRRWPWSDFDYWENKEVFFVLLLTSLGGLLRGSVPKKSLQVLPRDFLRRCFLVDHTKPSYNLAALLPQLLLVRYMFAWMTIL